MALLLVPGCLVVRLRLSLAYKGYHVLAYKGYRNGGARVCCSSAVSPSAPRGCRRAWSAPRGGGRPGRGVVGGRVVPRPRPAQQLRPVRDLLQGAAAAEPAHAGAAPAGAAQAARAHVRADERAHARAVARQHDVQREVRVR